MFSLLYASVWMCPGAHGVLTPTQGHPEGARPAGESLDLPDGKEMGQSEEEIQGSSPTSSLPEAEDQLLLFSVSVIVNKSHDQTQTNMIVHQHCLTSCLWLSAQVPTEHVNL